MRSYIRLGFSISISIVQKKYVTKKEKMIDKGPKLL